ncbi:hypothetical protein Bca4012_062053 [Brassica carinata]|uniref:Uncharacterized protein n=1 Tax=Brassica carinata TaxID=52824 RepID=A0A8X7SC37_BRACI|nr:hypothetical protein Bca52824_031933 [Brassica carinata]
MDSNPVEMSTGYVDLLTSQHGFSYVPLSSSSQVPVFGTQGTEASSPPEVTPAEQERPQGVKAAKRKKKKNFDGKETVSQLQTIFEWKKNDLISKERLAKIKILDKLLAKNEGLDEFEDGLKKKLIEELF